MPARRPHPHRHTHQRACHFTDQHKPAHPAPADGHPGPGPARRALNSEGPWLLIETGQGLWAVNPDGSGLTQLTNVDYWHGDLQAAVQPGGNQVVFISPGDYDFHHMALNLLTLPDGKVTKITDLTSPETEAYADSGPGDTGFEALRAVGEQSSYAWSPDGTRLAFVGVMDGPSAELYLYDETTPKITRVSQDNTQDFGPSWSPDGKHLLYLGADGFGTGAGFAMSGVWAAAGDGSGASQLYATDSSGEEIVGWLDNTTAVLDTWSIVCGPGKLRLYDVVSRQQTMLNDGCISSAAANGGRGAAMFTNDSGLYMLTAEAPAPVQVSQEPGARIDPWGPDDYVFTVRFENGGIATYGTGDMEHQVSPVSAPPREVWRWPCTASSGAGPARTPPNPAPGSAARAWRSARSIQAKPAARPGTRTTTCCSLPGQTRAATTSCDHLRRLLYGSLQCQPHRRRCQQRRLAGRPR